MNEQNWRPARNNDEMIITKTNGEKKKLHIVKLFYFFVIRHIRCALNLRYLAGLDSYRRRQHPETSCLAREGTWSSEPDNRFRWKKLSVCLVPD